MDKEKCLSHDWEKVIVAIHVVGKDQNNPFKNPVPAELLECKNCEALAHWNNKTGHKSLIKNPMTKEQNETELTLEERERSFHESKCDGCDCNIGNAEYTVFVKEEINRAEQSLKQKVEKMLEGKVRQIEIPDNQNILDKSVKDKNLISTGYNEALEEAKNNLEDL